VALLYFLGTSCNVKDHTSEVTFKEAYSLLLEEDEDVVHVYAPKIITDYEDQLLVIPFDGKAIVQYDRRKGSILKKNLISDLPQEEILSDLISRFSPEADVDDVLSDAFAIEAMRFYAFIESDNEVMVALSMQIPKDSTIEYEGEMVRARVFGFGLAVLSLDKNLNYKEHQVLYTSGMEARLVNPASSDWLKKDNHLAIPLQFGNEASPGYRYIVMRKTELGYKFSWLGSLQDLQGIKAYDDGFKKFAWSFSNNLVSVGNSIYEMVGLTETGLELNEKYLVDNSTQGIRNFIIQNDAIYYEVGHPVDVFNSDTSRFEVRSVSLDGNNEKGKSIISREKRFEYSPCHFTEYGVYFINKPPNEPCELEFHPYR